MPTWVLATALRRHATGLSVVAIIGPELDAIRSRRSLLDETDPVRPLVATLTTALRDALTTIHLELTKKIQAAATTLANDSTWSALSAEVQDEIRRRLHLQAPPALSIGTDENLKTTLDDRPHHAWRSEIDAVDMHGSPTHWTRAPEHLQESELRPSHDDDSGSSRNLGR